MKRFNKITLLIILIIINVANTTKAQVKSKTDAQIITDIKKIVFIKLTVK